MHQPPHFEIAPLPLVHIVIMLDPIIHTDASPYCNDPTCPCHENEQEAPTPQGYVPDGSNYHDHLCRCPGCDYDGPDLTDEEIADIMAQPSPLDRDIEEGYARIRRNVQRLIELL